MVRKAFLIGGTYATQLPGVKSDIAAWKCFLSTSNGGCWNQSELCDLSGLSRGSLLHTVYTIGHAIDYALVCFSGHGEERTDEYGFSRTHLWLNDTELISEREINPLCPRVLMVFDCCRSHPVYDIAMHSQTSEGTDAGRDVYCDEILKCEKGLIKVYAAGDGESAADDISFTRTLIACGMKHKGSMPLDIASATDMVKEILSPQRTPQCVGGRRRRYYPFAFA